MLLESIIRKFLFEDIRVLFKDSPARIQDLARSLSGTAFRVKMVDTVNQLTVDDILSRVRQNTQFGAASNYANPEYTYIMSADLRDSENKMVFDFIIGKTADVQKKYGTLPGVTSKIGRADVYQDDVLSERTGKLGQTLKALGKALNIALGKDATVATTPTTNTVTNLKSVGVNSAVNEPIDQSVKSNTEVPNNKIGNIIIPTGGFKFGLKGDTELKKLQDVLKSKLIGSTIQSKPIVKKFTSVRNMTGIYGPITRDLIAYLKGGWKFNNTDGNVIEQAFVKLIFSKFGLQEQFDDFDDTAAEQAVIKQTQPTQTAPATQSQTQGSTETPQASTTSTEKPKLKQHSKQSKLKYDPTQARDLIVKHATGPKANLTYLLSTDATWVDAWAYAIWLHNGSEKYKWQTTFKWGGKIWNIFTGEWTKYTSDLIGKNVYGLGLPFIPYATPDWSADHRWSGVTAYKDDWVGQIMTLYYNPKDKSLWFYIKYTAKYQDTYKWINHRDNLDIYEFNRPFKTREQSRMSKQNARLKTQKKNNA